MGLEWLIFGFSVEIFEKNNISIEFPRDSLGNFNFDKKKYRFFKFQKKRDGLMESLEGMKAGIDVKLQEAPLRLTSDSVATLHNDGMDSEGLEDEDKEDEDRQSDEEDMVILNLSLFAEPYS